MYVANRASLLIIARDSTLTEAVVAAVIYHIAEVPKTVSRRPRQAAAYNRPKGALLPGCSTTAAIASHSV